LELKAEKQSAHSDVVLSVAFSPDGTKIVSGSADKTIKVWSAGRLARTPPAPHGGERSQHAKGLRGGGKYHPRTAAALRPGRAATAGLEG
jgi:hypothetical protein